MRKVSKSDKSMENSKQKDSYEMLSLPKTIEKLKLIDLASTELKKDMEKLVNNKFDIYTQNETDWVKIWPKIIGPELFSDCVIPIKKQTKIIGDLLPNVRKFLIKKNDMIVNYGIKWAGRNKADLKELLEEESWIAENTTYSERGYRLTFGLKTRGCEYWSEDKLKMGCLNCGYFAGVAFETDITSEELVKQFNHAIDYADSNYKIKYDTIEILSDGSFLNNNEVPPDAREKIFKIISKKKNVKRVLVETRTEFIDKKEVEKLLKILRKDQELEIGIGLETADRFIINFLIHKGFEKDSFENVVKLLHDLERVKLVAYCLVKPAFLTDKEAIEDTVKTVIFLEGLNKKYNMDITPKLEPVVVAEGTLLEILNQKKKNDPTYYKPPSYWSIMEILARLADKGMLDLLVIGAREDMDVFKAIPAIEYDIGQLSKIDFLVYGAIQQFNKHRKMTRLLADIEPAFKDRSFKEWMNKNKIKKSAIQKLREKYSAEIKVIQSEPRYLKRTEFFEKLFDCLDKIEYGKKTQDLAAHGKIRELNKHIKSLLKENLGNITVYIGNQELLDYGLKLLRMNINIHSKEINEKHSIWLGIPTSRYVGLEEV